MRTVIVSALVSIIVLALAFGYVRSNPALLGPATAAKESTWARIQRTGEIHCGYTSWDPLFFIDPKTNEKKGVFHDEMEELGKRLGLKIIWQEEIGWGSITESVRTGRVDMACSGYWLNPARIKMVASSVPQVYAPLYVWVRGNETRPLNTLDDMNSDQLTAALIDGSAEGSIIASRFPKAKILSLPELDTDSDEIEAVVTGKADFIVTDPGSMAPYIANNPGKIKPLFIDQPLNVFPNVMLLPPDDPRFKEVIDNTLLNIEYDGTLDRIIQAYHGKDLFLRNAPPVRLAP
jgi:ABC-type amino acid transport substrate-binding protein